MNEPEEDILSQDEAPEASAPQDSEGEQQQREKDNFFKRNVLSVWFVVGFIGWFLIMALFYGQVADSEAMMICAGLFFPVHVIAVILLIKLVPSVGWGMLSAIGVNLVISMILSLFTNALCFIPFFKPMR